MDNHMISLSLHVFLERSEKWTLNWINHVINSCSSPIFVAGQYGKIILLHSVEPMYGQVTCLDQWAKMSVLGGGFKGQHITSQFLFPICYNYCQCSRWMLLCQPGSQKEGDVESRTTVNIQWIYNMSRKSTLFVRHWDFRLVCYNSIQTPNLLLLTQCLKSSIQFKTGVARYYLTVH